jgi:predicted amidohydrolase
MTPNLIVACVQVNAGPEIAPNLAQAETLIRAAAAQGANLVALPENVSLMTADRDRLFAQAFREEEHPAIPCFSRLARETGAWILGGTLGVKVESDRLANRSYLFNAKGGIAAAYDKIHMFDVDLDHGESYRESSIFRPGNRAVAAETPWGLLGMTVCYDVRFPHLYRALARAGARIIAVPAAFTAQTGAAHWHVLLRARAIETGAFIIAPAQCGTHDGGRATYGHSLIVNPWGRIVAEARTEPCIVAATLDGAEVDEARRKIPSLRHDCLFAGP